MNKVILMGRLTADPEMRSTSTNKSVCTFRLAVNRSFSRQGEEQQADFLPIVTWEKTAEFCNNYFKKGQQVAIVGRIQTRTWDDPEGNKRYITEVVANEAYFADSKNNTTSDNNNSNVHEGNTGYYPVEADDELPF